MGESQAVRWRPSFTDCLRCWFNMLAWLNRWWTHCKNYICSLIATRWPDGEVLARCIRAVTLKKRLQLKCTNNCKLHSKFTQHTRCPKLPWLSDLRCCLWLEDRNVSYIFCCVAARRQSRPTRTQNRELFLKFMLNGLGILPCGLQRFQMHVG